MKHSFWKVAVLGLLSIFFIGCGVKTKVYTIHVPRKDVQIVDKGNRGYVGGALPVSEREELEDKDKEIVTLEFSTGPKLEEEEMIETEVTTTEIVEESYYIEPESGLEVVEVEEVENVGVQEYEFYTVQKDDTLQKISYKFYNTNHKWVSIYEANKDVIADAHRIKPGIVLRIPVE